MSQPAPPVATNAHGHALALATQGLRRTFGDFVAVDGIDLAVPEGSFYGFLGPNGAGKSTTIKCLTGLLRPSAGTVRILGLDPERDAVAVKRRVGVVPEDLALFDRLTGAENLAFVARVHGLERATFERRAAELLELLELADAAVALAADYSHGMRKKLSLAMALLPSPRLLFLDEPFEGIDAVSSRLVKRFLLRVHRPRRHCLPHLARVRDRRTAGRPRRHHPPRPAGGAGTDRRAARPARRRDGGACGPRSLEDLFLGIVGATALHDEPALEWLGDVRQPNVRLLRLLAALALATLARPRQRARRQAAQRRRPRSRRGSGCCSPSSSAWSASLGRRPIDRCLVRRSLLVGGDVGGPRLSASASPAASSACCSRSSP